VVVVVPAVAEREPGEPGQVAALVGERVAPGAEVMAERCHREGQVVEHDRADAEAPDDELRSRHAERRCPRRESLARRIKGRGQAQRCQPVEALQPDQLRNPQQIRYGFERRARVLAT